MIRKVEVKYERVSAPILVRTLRIQVFDAPSCLITLPQWHFRVTANRNPNRNSPYSGNLTSFDAHLALSRPYIDERGEAFQDFQGFSIATPVPAKSASFRVATVMRCTNAVAAIKPSRIGRGFGT
jgi:hypothetical protein